MKNAAKLAIIGSRGYPSTYGGYETLVRRLAPALVEEGHNVTVFCRDAPGSERRWTVDGVECRLTPGIESRSASTLTFGASASAAAAVAGFDAALVLNIANGFWLPVLKAGGVATALNTDGIEWERAKWGTNARRVFKAGAWMSAKFATKLVADSEEMARVYRDEFAVDSVFIPYGADISAESGSSRLTKENLPESGYALVVARLVPENNVELILDAFDVLGDQAPHLIVVGQSTYGDPIESRLNSSSASGRTTWLGHVNDQDLLAELWSNASILIHGHSAGGTNPALLQAMGAGAPVLALDTAFNREVLRYDDQLFKKDPHALAKRITELVQDDTLRAGWSLRGQQSIMARYQWGSVIAAYRSLLEELASR